MDFVGRPEAMALAQPAVDRIVHLPDSVVTGRVEVDARGEVYFVNLSCTGRAGDVLLDSSLIP